MQEKGLAMRWRSGANTVYESEKVGTANVFRKAQIHETDGIAKFRLEIHTMPEA